MHVQVAVRAQAATEENVVIVRLFRRKVTVSQQLVAVFRCVDGIVRFVGVLGEATEFLHDDRFIARVPVFPLGVEVAELMDAGVFHIGIVVIHHRRALEVSGIEHFRFEIEGAPSQAPLGVVEVPVQRPGIDDGSLGRGRAKFVANLKPIGVQPNRVVLMIGHPFQPGGVSVDRKPLVGVVEVSVIEGVPNGKT